MLTSYKTKECCPIPPKRRRNQNDPDPILDPAPVTSDGGTFCRPLSVYNQATHLLRTRFATPCTTFRRDSVSCLPRVTRSCVHSCCLPLHAIMLLGLRVRFDDHKAISVPCGYVYSESTPPLLSRKPAEQTQHYVLTSVKNPWPPYQ
jgi:hypothetical protein